MSMKLYVGNLSFQTTRQDLEAAFAQAGTVQSVNVIEDRDTGRSRGFAFVIAAETAVATKAAVAGIASRAGNTNQITSVYNTIDRERLKTRE